MSSRAGQTSRNVSAARFTVRAEGNELAKVGYHADLVERAALSSAFSVIDLVHDIVMEVLRPFATECLLLSPSDSSCSLSLEGEIRESKKNRDLKSEKDSLRDMRFSSCASLKLCIGQTCIYVLISHCKPHFEKDNALSPECHGMTR